MTSLLDTIFGCFILMLALYSFKAFMKEANPFLEFFFAIVTIVLAFFGILYLILQIIKGINEALENEDFNTDFKSAKS